ncbi:amino acid ABC transporter permease [Lysinibacillus endophyticus]|uniref:Amino acid ABC transporter permease n=1 Tax=Ureibacillus endophyticus TaxID=1978490 RepID=A0A494YXQ0_9BACL|nr:amino acid ABC transporter permease [Lysinibacillus endophyticus]MCP1143196.1 amino acid ABC transporter permease [Lysinibacillus endophyticus]RKQ14980.1 amino acid ABC transporter permease [Lysinibacillus endophyticus]
MTFDWQYIVDVLPHYKTALWLTLKLATIGIAFAIIVGMICSIIQYFKVKVLSQIVQVYLEVARNTPLLIQLFFLYYGLPKIGITLSGELCGIIGLTFLGGSYMAEAFRAGMEAVTKSQIETGKAIGLSNLQLMRYVIIPQAFSYSVPGFGANCIFLLKETSVFSGIAILELTNTTKNLMGIFYKTNEALLMLVVGYLIILLPLTLFLTWLERRVRHAEFGN